MAQYYGVTRSGNELSHYGIKGMRWGVRKAIARGNERALRRHYRKAAKKLAKLTDIGVNSKKYAAKSAAYGAAAAGTGALAVGGTKMAGKIFRKAGKVIDSKLPAFETYYHLTPQPKTSKLYISKLKRQIKNPAAKALETAAAGIENFGNKAYATRKVREFVENAGGERMLRPDGAYMTKTSFVPTITGEHIYRTGAGLVTAGLAAKSAQNAYRASHGAKYRAKALQFKNEMDNAFKGTKYAGHYERPQRRKNRRIK